MKMKKTTFLLSVTVAVNSICFGVKEFDKSDISSVKEYFCEAVAKFKNDHNLSDFKKVAEQCRDFIKQNYPSEEAEIASMLDVENLIEEIIFYKKNLENGGERNEEKEEYFKSFWGAYSEEVNELILSMFESEKQNVAAEVGAIDEHQGFETNSIDAPEDNKSQPIQDYLKEFEEKK
jgi:hypothetical protein